MKVQDCMTRKVTLASPDQPIREVAALMGQLNAGAMPVGEDDRLIGMITDRDIAVRAIGKGMGPDTPVRDVMSRDVLYCFEDETVEHVAQNMGDIQVRRLPVMNRNRRMVGIVTIGDIACGSDSVSKVVGQALGGISRAGGIHLS